MRSLNTLYTLCVIFIGFTAMVIYKNSTDAVKECAIPMANAVDMSEMQRALDNECKRPQAQGHAAEVFLNALTK